MQAAPLPPAKRPGTAWPGAAARPADAMLRPGGGRERHSWWIGLVGTLVLNCLVLLGFHLLPGSSTQGSDLWLTQADAGKHFDIEISEAPAEEAVQSPKPPPSQNFVEANPDAPENVPDDTNNFSAHNQQAAQENPAKDQHEDHAAVEGQKDIESKALVSGHFREPMPIAQPQPADQSPPEPTQAQQAEAAAREQVPLPGKDHVEGDNTAGFGTNVAEDAPNVNDATEQVKGLPDAPRLTGIGVAPMQIDPSHPAPRIRIDQNVRPAPIFEQKFGTDHVGVAAWDSRWSEYGAYLQRVLDTVDSQWRKRLNDSQVMPPVGTQVQVKFRLNKDGLVTDLKVDGNAGEQGRQLCINAILERGRDAPGYGKWSDAMVAQLGDDQELTFNFYFY